MEADAALGGPDGRVVHDAISVEDLDRTIIHFHGNGDGRPALGMAENFDQSIFETHFFRCCIKVLECGVKENVRRSTLNH